MGVLRNLWPPAVSACDELRTVKMLTPPRDKIPHWLSTNGKRKYELRLDDRHLRSLSELSGDQELSVVHQCDLRIWLQRRPSVYGSGLTSDLHE